MGSISCQRFDGQMWLSNRGGISLLNYNDLECFSNRDYTPKAEAADSRTHSCQYISAIEPNVKYSYRGKYARRELIIHPWVFFSRSSTSVWNRCDKPSVSQSSSGNIWCEMHTTGAETRPAANRTNWIVPSLVPASSHPPPHISFVATSLPPAKKVT